MKWTLGAYLLYLNTASNSLMFFLQFFSQTTLILTQAIVVILVIASLVAYRIKSEKRKVQIRLDRCIRELVSCTMQYEHVIELVNEIKYELDNYNPDGQSVSVDLRRKIEVTIDNQVEWKNFMKHFEEVHPRFYSKLTKASAQITQYELRLCSYIRIGLTNKEIASLLNTTSKSVEMAKYRLKKTLKLSEDQSLVQYISSI